jgi:rhodanese-related sulfurtransferase
MVLLTNKDKDYLNRNFEIHEDTDEVEDIHELMKATAARIIQLCPYSRERSIVMTKLEEALFWAVASVTRGE